MKKALLLIALAGGWMATQAQDELINKVKDNGGEDGYVFETVINLDATDVKNQGSSGTCWSYCTTSFLESEMIRMGKEPVDVAEMYTVRKTYEDKADKYVRLHGHLNFGQGGALLDVMHVIKYYGTADLCIISIWVVRSFNNYWLLHFCYTFWATWKVHYLASS